MYGISKTDKMVFVEKLKNQQRFLNENFISFDGVNLPLSNFYFSSWHNSGRYISELNNRVYSMSEYAKENGLKAIFCVFTLPTEYHREKTIKTKSGKIVSVKNDKFIDDEAHSVKAGSDKLQNIIRSFLNSKVMRTIPSDKRCYITTKEPHKDGTPHLNLLLFIPPKFEANVIKAIKRRFISQQNEIQTDIKDATAYIMKYIFKTLDDLRDNPNVENLSDITIWYLKHKIRRVTMSKTFISLEIYRKLNGRIGLIELTKNYNKGLITILLDENRKVVQIFDEFGDLWQKTNIKQKFSYNSTFKFAKDENGNYIKENAKFEPEMLSSWTQKPFAKMSDLELCDLRLHYDLSYMNSQKIALLENELCRRNLANLTTNKKYLNPNNMHDLDNHYANFGLKAIPF